MSSPSDNERIAVLETEVRSLKDVVDKMDKKMDEFLALKHKGLGAFWLASTIMGTGIAGVLLSLLDWFKGSPGG